MSNGAFQFKYEASPTGARFHMDQSRFRAIMGPVGSGKTSISVVELIMWGVQQKEARDRVRRTKFAVVRATYPELEATTIETFKNWLGPLLRIKRTTPIRGYVQFPLEDGTRVEIELVFLALDREDDISRKLKSLELTGAFINEASEVSETVFTDLKERIGRYPDPNTGTGATRVGMILDTNPPNDRHWFFRTFETERPLGHVLYKQPPAVIPDDTSPIKDTSGQGWAPNPDAENIMHLEEGFGYYMNAIPGQSNSHVRNRYAAEYGSVHTSGAVYANYSASDHKTAQAVPVSYGQHVYLGFDWGLHPAMVACQLGPTGTLQVLAELAPKDVDFLTFLDKMVVPTLRARFGSCRILAVGDPAGSQRSDLAKIDRFKEVRKRGIAIKPARTNDPTVRKEALDYWLNMRNGFLIDGSMCPVLAEALSGGYQFTKPKDDGLSERFKKNYYSHIMDALQYVAMELKFGFLAGGSDALGIPRGAHHPHQQRPMRVNGAGFGGQNVAGANQGGRYLWA